jgi:hypothetical protein
MSWMKPSSISLGREMMAKWDPTQLFLLMATDVNYAIQKNTWPQLVLNSLTLSQNVPSVEGGTKLKIVV